MRQYTSFGFEKLSVIFELRLAADYVTLLFYSSSSPASGLKPQVTLKQCSNSAFDLAVVQST